MRLMVGIQPAAIVFLKLLVGFLRSQSVEGILNHTCLVGIGSIDALDGGIGRESLALTFLAVLIDANYLEGEVAHLHMLA